MKYMPDDLNTMAEDLGEEAVDPAAADATDTCCADITCPSCGKTISLTANEGDAAEEDTEPEDNAMEEADEAPAPAAKPRMNKAKAAMKFLE
jgi:hypothetical protein